MPWLRLVVEKKKKLLHDASCEISSGWFGLASMINRESITEYRCVTDTESSKTQMGLRTGSVSALLLLFFRMRLLTL